MSQHLDLQPVHHINVELLPDRLEPKIGKSPPLGKTTTARLVITGAHEGVICADAACCSNSSSSGIHTLAWRPLLRLDADSTAGYDAACATAAAGAASIFTILAVLDAPPGFAG